MALVRHDRASGRRTKNGASDSARMPKGAQSRGFAAAFGQATSTASATMAAPPRAPMLHRHTLTRGAGTASGRRACKATTPPEPRKAWAV